MADQIHDKRPHLVLTNTSKAQSFTAPSARGGPPEIPAPDRAQHGAALRDQLLALKPFATQAVTVQTEQGLQSGLGLQIQFVGLPGVALAFESLGSELGRDPQSIFQSRFESERTGFDLESELCSVRSNS